MVTNPILNRVYGWLYGGPSQLEPVIEAPSASEGALPVITMAELSSSFSVPMRAGWHDGEKFPGGFGATALLTTDYWTLRARSQQLFKTNIYARGIVRRLVTNIINVGLALEAVPEAGILGINEEVLADWTEAVENRWQLWERSPSLSDYKGLKNFGGLQAAALQAALISGDVLVVLHQDPATGLPLVRLVDGNRIQSPFGATPTAPALPPGHSIKHGVELDPDGRHVAFWIVSNDERTFERRVQRLPAVGPTGRRSAWLVYGSHKLLDEVRGEPILSIMLQSLNEIDRYRDAVQRKAIVNAIVSMFILRKEAGPIVSPFGGGAKRKSDSLPSAVAGNPPARNWNFTDQIPGAVLDMLAPGEEPKGFQPTGTDEKFADFEAAIVYAMSWALELPPEILTLSFKNNYSASQAAIQEFKMFLALARADFGDAFCQPIYEEFLLCEVLAGRIKAESLLASWREPLQFDRYAAWIAADWGGAIKPSIDMLKAANAYTQMVEQGFITRDRATRELTGTKYSKNAIKLRRENEQLAAANKAIQEMEKPAAPIAPAAPLKRDLTVVPKQEDEDNDVLAS